MGREFRLFLIVLAERFPIKLCFGGMDERKLSEVRAKACYTAFNCFGVDLWIDWSIDLIDPSID